MDVPDPWLDRAWLDHPLPQGYSPPQPGEIDISDHDQLILLAKYLGLGPGDALVVTSTNAMAIVTDVPEAGLPAIANKIAELERGWWAVVGVEAIDAEHFGFAVVTSAE